MATNETYISGQLYLINLSDLLPDPDQPRKYMGPAAQNACNAVAAIGSKISDLDVTSLTREERDSFANALDTLKQIIESKFQAMAQ